MFRFVCLGWQACNSLDRSCDISSQYQKLAQKLASVDAKIAALPACVPVTPAGATQAAPCVNPAATKLEAKKITIKAEMDALVSGGLDAAAMAAKVDASKAATVVCWFE
jgi:hypothetical protein